MKHLADVGIETPVINLPTCPVNPEWVVAMVVEYLILERLPEMDSFNRPVAIFGQTIHDNCPRRGHFENGEFVREFGSEEEAKGYCLYTVGCKGPQTFTNCPIVRWDKRASWCVESGSPCIGCGTADPISGGASNWVDMNAPFLNRHRDLPFGDGTVQATTVGAVAGGAMAAGLAIHGLAVKGTGQGKADKKKGGDE
jgi:hydrogenase small subunit